MQTRFFLKILTEVIKIRVFVAVVLATHLCDSVSLAPYVYISIYIYMHIFERIYLNELTKRNGWLSLLSTSPRRTTNCQESGVDWDNRYFAHVHVSSLYF